MYANNGQSKVIAVSGRTRRDHCSPASAARPTYMAGAAACQRTYYMKAHPDWHNRYYAGKPQDKWMGESWAPLLPDAAYARSTAEGQPWQPRDFAGMGGRFPFKLPGSEKLQAYRTALMRTPFGDEATLDFARAAIEGESLGRNAAGVTDILGVSLSTHDYVNHGYGPESRVSQDHLLRVDRALAGFFDYLDRRIGLANVLIVLTADHGFMNAPEFSAALGLNGARLNAPKMMAELNAVLTARFGTKGNIAVRLSYPTVILDQQLIEKSAINRGEVESLAQRFLQAYPGVAAVYTRSQLESGALPDLPLAAAVQRAWNRELSGDLYVVQNSFSLYGSLGVTHGSPYSYDTNVPLMLYGKTWIRPGKYPRAAAVADIAPTLSYLLEIRPPSASEGRALEEILK
jgi:hypothetical protein